MPDNEPSVNWPPALLPLTPTLMLASWSWRRAALALGWPLAPLVARLDRDAALMAMNVRVLVWARYATLRWYELNPAPLILPAASGSADAPKPPQ